MPKSITANLPIDPLSTWGLGKASHSTQRFLVPLLVGLAALIASTVLAQITSQMRYQSYLESTLNILRQSAYVDQLSTRGLPLYSKIVYSTVQAGTHLNEERAEDRLSFSLCEGGTSVATIPVWLPSEELPCSPSLARGFNWRWGQVRVDTDLPEITPPLSVRLKLGVPWFGYSTLLINAIFFLTILLITRWGFRHRRERAQIDWVFIRMAGALDIHPPVPEKPFRPWSGEAAFLFERKIQDLKRDLDEAQAQKVSLQTEAMLGRLTAQVAHDIRSPLTVLQLLVEQIPKTDGRYRALASSAVRRIQGIASDIAANYREMTQAGRPPNRQSVPHAVAPLVEDIVVEKRLEANIFPTLHIVFEPQGAAAEQGFAKIDAGVFKRVLSNLINNSIEAVSPKDGGEVRIAVACEHGNIQVEISDNGPGIPAELLRRIGERGASSGKRGGLGLGLHHARESVTHWGGQLEVISRPGAGTQIRILLPAIESPPWFVSRITITPRAHIVVLDDDDLVHELWAQRLAELSAHSIEIEHFRTVEKFQRSYRPRERAGNTGADLLLVDQELLGAIKTGLDLIEEWKVADRSILVTGAYDEVGVIERCARLGVRLLPKPLIAKVPLEVVSAIANQAGQNFLRPKPGMYPLA